MKAAFTLFLILFAITQVAAEDRFVSQTHGFEISTPATADFTGVYQHSLFYLPVTDGFGANVNVQVQPFNGTLQEYEKISLEEFKKMGLKVLSSDLKNSAFTIEYAGKMGNYDLHWYARALQKEGKVYLVTATALESRWKTQGPILTSSVQSFKLKN